VTGGDDDIRDEMLRKKSLEISQLQHEVETLRSRFRKRCLVLNCENHTDEGDFVGDLCSPCYGFITKGTGTCSQAYRNAMATAVNILGGKL
jgi:hypothetical protein